MPNLDPQTVVGHRPCRDCGKPVSLKIDKKGKAYAYCPHSLEDGAYCGGVEKWGNRPSQQFQSAFIANGRSPVNYRAGETKPHDEDTFEDRAKAAKGQGETGDDTGTGSEVSDQPGNDDDGDLYKHYGYG